MSDTESQSQHGGEHKPGNRGVRRKKKELRENVTEEEGPVSSARRLLDELMNDHEFAIHQEAEAELVKYFGRMLRSQNRIAGKALVNKWWNNRKVIRNKFFEMAQAGNVRANDGRFLLREAGARQIIMWECPPASGRKSR